MLAFVFAGQGDQSVGMGKSLCDANPAARKLFDRASEILGFDLVNVCFEGPAERIDSWEHRCADCGYRETQAFRASELTPGPQAANPRICPFCRREGAKTD